MTDLSQKEKKSQLTVARASIVLSIIIFLITLSAGIISDSITLLLDASAEFVIVFMAFMLRSSIKKINLPPDKYFNFGYDKFEPFTVVIQGGMIMLSCVIASYFALQDIIHADDVARYDIPVIASLTSGLISLFTAFYIRRTAVRTHSHMLKTSGLHWLIDSTLSFAMVAGFVFGFYMHQMGYSRITPYVDPAMTLILASILVWTPLKLIKGGLRQLLDAAPDKDVSDEIEKILETHGARAFGIRSVRMRKAGEKVFLYVCFEIHGHTTMIQANEFVKVFEKDMAARFPKYDIIVYFYPTAAGFSGPIKKALVLALICFFISGCSGLMLEERERKLDEDFQENKINKVQYYTLKNKIEQERAQKDLASAEN